MGKDIIITGCRQPSISFVDIVTGEVRPDIWKNLQEGLWREFCIENYLTNDRIGEVEQNKWLPVFPDIKVINPGFKWNSSKKIIEEDLYKPKHVEASLNTFLCEAEKFFHQFDGKKIGVHLSGGLDSSLIICLLKYFNIPFVAIGLCSNRFEFRTEKHIQELLGNFASEAELYDMDDYPFFAHLDKKPKHQVPDSNIKMIDASTHLANKFKEKGCDVVFSGQGGDTLLAESIGGRSFKGYNIGNEFLFPWERDFLYDPLGIELLSFFSAPDIIDQITSLRSDKPSDPLKIWARNFFKEILPRELSEYSYSADFLGYSMDGLHNAKPEFELLFEEAHERLGHPMFSAKGIKHLLNTDMLALEYNTYCEFCSKLSIAVWVHSLFRKDD